MSKNVVKGRIAGRWRLHCLPSLAYLLLSFALPCDAAPSKAASGVQPYITLTFPRTELGSYCIIKPGTIYTNDLRMSDYKPARGTVNIPADSRISLKLGYNVHSNSRQLKEISKQAVRYLDLSKMEIDDAEFQDLLHFTDLVSLDMGSTDISDGGTVGLRNLTKLQNLDVGFCPIGLGTVEEISNLKKLIRLSFASNTLGDKAGPMLAKLKKLQVLVLSTTVITDSCVKDISTLSDLQELGLSRNNVTDKCIDSILKLKRLKRLNLSDTRVTFAGLMRLNQLPMLSNLLLRKSLLSTEQLKQLQRRLPKVIIEEGTKAKDFDPDLFKPIH
ncbi:MAG: hypothetical protein Q8T09_17535 [Candidatus Melainabacteria bacterium]|nr:hypothetical protein [Candidatus Melainabacteria bacterium]